MINISEIRKEFPYLKSNPDLIFFDNASTTQKPASVIKAVNEYYTDYNANAGRGSYSNANKTTIKIEEVRKKVARFINANNFDEVVFTSGSTQSLNTIAYSWGLHNLKDGDEVLLCKSDHESNYLPWANIQEILKSFNINIQLVEFNMHIDGDYDLDDLKNKITTKTRIVIATHIHNITGMEMEIKLLRETVPSNILIALDASQSIGHIEIDIQKLAIDFLSFSGHKIFADTGVGVLWINNKLINQIKPFLVGGKAKSLHNLHNKLETGTLNISGIISLGAAIDFINQIGIEHINTHLLTLTQYSLQELRQIKNIDFLPGPAYSKCAIGFGILSFRIKGVKSSDLGFMLNDNNIAVRSTEFCTSSSDFDDCLRISLQIYNTKEEVDKLIKVLKTL